MLAPSIHPDLAVDFLRQLHIVFDSLRQLKFLLLELRVLNTGSCPEIKWRSPLWPLPHPGPVRAEGSGPPHQPATYHGVVHPE